MDAKEIRALLWESYQRDKAKLPEGALDAKLLMLSEIAAHLAEQTEILGQIRKTLEQWRWR